MFRKGDFSKLQKAGFPQFLLLLEASILLLYARLAITCLPIARVLRLFDLETASSTFPTNMSPEVRTEDISWAITTAASRLPLNCTCLVKALAGSVLLQRRHIPSLLFLGVSRSTAPENSLAAHAWLECNDEILTGGSERALFKQIAAYRNRKATSTSTVQAP
ncbi:lasso peptide biosynthesis B2 protein [Thalassospira lucentensis]|uniref:lasso peptide biosynthesis B2 protein n=1 Tax=Thalassospira lucentensis TaxID=168935 RepID=UPI00142DD1B4|nr:lasso peptide biosynthesis B2 protein [Thalassospira lucentensis]